MKDVSPAAIGEIISNMKCLPKLPFDIYVPRCKRKKAHSRSYSLQRVEALHASPVEEKNNPSLQDYNGLNKMKNTHHKFHKWAS